MVKSGSARRSLITSVDTSTLPGGVMISVATFSPSFSATARELAMGSRPNSVSEYTKATFAPGCSLAM
ncbi:hypothetical protein D3C87_1980170 [compost metagenome]